MVWCCIGAQSTNSVKNTPSKMSLPSSLLLLLLFLNSLLQVVGYGESCDVNKLSQCKENEVCNLKSSIATCQCLPGFFEYQPTKSCVKEDPGPPSNSSSGGLAVGLTLLFLFIIAVAVIGFLHYKYRILSRLHRRYSIWRSSLRLGQAYEVGINDDNPIV